MVRLASFILLDLQRSVDGSKCTLSFFGFYFSIVFSLPFSGLAISLFGVTSALTVARIGVCNPSSGCVGRVPWLVLHCTGVDGSGVFVPGVSSSSVGCVSVTVNVASVYCFSPSAGGLFVSVAVVVMSP